MKELPRTRSAEQWGQTAADPEARKEMLELLDDVRSKVTECEIAGVFVIVVHGSGMILSKAAEGTGGLTLVEKVVVLESVYEDIRRMFEQEYPDVFEGSVSQKVN